MKLSRSGRIAMKIEAVSDPVGTLNRLTIKSC